MYFAAMIFVNNRFLGLAIVGGLFFAACNGNNNESDGKQEKNDSITSADSVRSADADLVGTDSGILVVEVKRESSELLGMWQQMPISGIREAIKTNAQLIINRIVKDKYKMMGGLTVLYKEFPSKGSVDIFIGIPVDGLRNGALNKGLSDGFLIEKIEGGTYLKATVNAEPGATMIEWEKFKKLMLKRGVYAEESLSKNAAFPYFEYYQDSRNAEMTTTVAQAVLVMKKP